MFKAKERKEQELKENVDNKLSNLTLQEDHYFIDLVKAIEDTKGEHHVQINNEESRSSSPYMLLEYKDIVLEEEVKIEENVFELPMTDISYILKQNVKKVRCSPFGKVLSARLRPVAAPYLHDKTVTTIKRFDFNSKSPCDCILEKLKRPTMSTLPSHVKLGIFDVDPVVMG